MTGLGRRLTAEALGTAILVATVIGSGIMATRLTRDVGLALLGNTIPTGAILVVLILMLGPVSGSHFNPAVSLMMAWRRQLRWGDVAPYVAAQIAGGIAGTIVAHLMFDQPALQVAQTIFGIVRFRPDSVAMAVGLYITAAYWFTASTSFANPAVTIARAFSDSFAGIAPSSVPAFIMAQLLGAFAGTMLAGWLFPPAPDEAAARAG